MSDIINTLYKKTISDDDVNTVEYSEEEEKFEATRCQQYGLASHPPEDDTLLVIPVLDDCTEEVAVDITSESRPKDLKEKEVVLYNDKMEVRLNSDSIKLRSRSENGTEADTTPLVMGDKLVDVLKKIKSALEQLQTAVTQGTYTDTTINLEGTTITQTRKLSISTATSLDTAIDAITNILMEGIQSSKIELEKED